MNPFATKSGEVEAASGKSRRKEEMNAEPSEREGSVGGTWVRRERTSEVTRAESERVKEATEKGKVTTFHTRPGDGGGGGAGRGIRGSDGLGSLEEIREKSFKDLGDESKEKDGGGFQSSASSREHRAKRKVEKNARKS